MTTKMRNRLLSILNYICTYEKKIFLNSRTKNVTDVIEEFDIKQNQLILYGQEDKHIIEYNNIKCEIYGVHIKLVFTGINEYRLMI